ncbi:polysaccharide biosynthesis protein [Gordonia sp. L191]|uniref:polysaccharide biosynthesis protein n=1 Tax=Gordonia sp. L191 TaxID=2982699 RepID=UPI0024C09ADC|nr:polysaccharide biosynthesis protein [Gordonia sp. L191]WHU46422.1 polysaccharide biosynthesis protein [Gordonia sp. L191]
MATAIRMRGLVGALGSVAAGSMTANLAAYVVYVGAGRWLAPGDYGQFARLLSAMLVLGVPALALQSVIAREVVRGRGSGLARVTATTVAAVVVLALVAVPVVVAVARTGAAATAAALAAAPLLVVIAAGQGVLQGLGEFRALAWVLGAVGIARSVPMLVAFALGAGPTWGLAVGTLGTAVAAAVVWSAVGVVRRADTGRTRRPPGVNGANPDTTTTGVGAAGVLRASQVQLVLIVAVSIDLLLSGTVLHPDDAGVYALGAVATKAAFWLPQAIGVVFYPRLADPARSRTALRQAVAVVASIGAILTVAAAALGPLVPLVVGDAYRPLVGLLWLFAYTGSAMAVLQVLLLSAIAADRTRASAVTWLVVGIEVIVIVCVVDSVVALAVTAAVAVTAAAVATGIDCVRAMSRTPIEADEVRRPA